MAEHAYNNDHRGAWDNVKVICKERQCSSWEWKKAWLIEQTNNVITNRDNRRTLPKVYKPLRRIYTGRERCDRRENCERRKRNFVSTPDASDG